VLLKCETTGKILKCFLGHLKLLTISLLVKYKNVHISANLSHVIISPNLGVEIIVVNYNLSIGL
jgi:hypothetical protein